MPNNLALSITVGASAGGTIGLFSNIKNAISKCAASTKLLTGEHKALGKSIEHAIANKAPASYIAHLTREYDKQAKKIDALKIKTRELSRVQEKTAALDARRGELRTQLMETAAIGWLAAKPLQTAISAETAFADVKKVVDGTEEELAALDKNILKMTQKYAIDYAGIAKIMADSAQGGVKKENLSGFTGLIAEMAVALDISTDAAGDAAAKLGNILKLGDDLERHRGLYDTINFLSNKDAAKGGQIIEVMKRAGSAINVSGLNERQGAGLASTFLALGQGQEVSGTAIENMLTRLNMLEKLGPKAQKALGQIGLTAQGFKQSFGKDAEGAITNLLERLQNVRQEDRTGILVDIFGRAGAADVGILVNGLETYRAAMARANDATATSGSLLAEFEARNGTTGNTLKLMENALKAVAIEASRDLLPALRELINDVIRPGIQWISNWAGENKELVGIIFRVVMGLIAFKLAFIGVQYAAILLISPFVKIWGLAVKILPAQAVARIVSFAAMLKGPLFTGLRMAGQAILFVGRALLMNPIGLLITGIAIAAFLIYRYWEPIKAFFIGIWNSITAFFSSGIGNITATILNWSPLGLFYKAFAAVLNWFGLELPSTFTGFGAKIIEGIGAGIDSAKAWLMEKLRALADMLPDCVQKVLGIASPSRVFAELGGFTMQGLADGLKSAAGLPLAALQGMAGTLAAAGSITLAGGMTPALAAPMGGSATSGGAAASIVINVYPTPGMDEKALANLVAQKLGEAQRTAAASQRSRLSDAD